MQTRRILIPGPPLIGFADVFDAGHGDEKTPRPYPEVTPSRIGYALLPFACPHCGAVKCEAVDPKRRDGYRDKQRGFSWCPACRKRYVLNTEGMPLPKSLPAGADHAPARIERGDKVEIAGARVEDGLTMLGAAQ
jgi:hypothetical protein